jgi:hypothetical protein
MTMGNDDCDALAYDLAQTDFEAAERDGLRAEWTEGNSRIEVSGLDGDQVVVYDAEDLVRAASDREVSNARAGGEPG